MGGKAARGETGTSSEGREPRRQARRKERRTRGKARPLPRRDVGTAKSIKRSWLGWGGEGHEIALLFIPDTFSPGDRQDCARDYVYDEYSKFAWGEEEHEHPIFCRKDCTGCERGGRLGGVRARARPNAAQDGVFHFLGQVDFQGRVQ